MIHCWFLSSDSLFTTYNSHCVYGRHKIKTILFLFLLYRLLTSIAMSRWSKHLTNVSFIFKSFLLFHLLSVFALIGLKTQMIEIKHRKLANVFPHFSLYINVYMNILRVFLLSHSFIESLTITRNVENPYQLKTERMLLWKCNKNWFENFSWENKILKLMCREYKKKEKYVELSADLFLLLMRQGLQWE